MSHADREPHLVDSRPQQPQTLLVLCGLPGSGKSTLAAQFQQHGWVVVCQDDLGGRQQCEAACAAALAAGRHCVVDRCNFNMSQRRTWLDIAQNYAQRSEAAVRAVALCLALPPEECLQRSQQRDAHATLPGSRAAEVIQRFLRDWQNPQPREGFHAVHAAHSSQEAQALVMQLLAAHGQPSLHTSVATAQHPQHRSYSSRADAASSWRRGAGGEASDQQQQQQQQWQPAAGKPPAGNVVPFPGGRGGRRGRAPAAPPLPHEPRPHPWHPPGTRYDQPHGVPRDAHLDAAKVVLLFDANGCITSHTSMRRSAGVHRARPGIHHLRRLKERYHLGLFSSASQRTVDVALALLEEAAGPGEPLFDRRLVLHRSHTFLSPATHVAAGGKPHDTCKPLAPHFARLHRVLLVDDDAHKSVVGEERNQVLMPVWRDDDPSDELVAALVDALLALAARLGDDPAADARAHTAAASAQLAAAAEQQRAARERAQGGAPTPAQLAPVPA